MPRILYPFHKILGPVPSDLMAPDFPVNVPEFDLNEPFTLGIEGEDVMDPEKKQDALNQMWRSAYI